MGEVSKGRITIDNASGIGGRAIAYSHRAPAQAGRPGIFWLSGFMSDMASTKATMLDAFAAEQGWGATRFDYSGHGVSGGAFTDGTIGRWLEEARIVFTTVAAGPQIIVGSSMGGHIALLLVRELLADAPAIAERIKGLVLIAPAWDMTEELMWNKFDDAIRYEILDNGFHMRPSAYDQPYTITRQLIEEGRSHLLARQPLTVPFPVVILQGVEDQDVPVTHARELVTFLRGDDVTLVEIADGEHRLSRPQDLEKLTGALKDIAAKTITDGG